MANNKPLAIFGALTVGMKYFLNLTLTLCFLLCLTNLSKAVTPVNKYQANYPYLLYVPPWYDTVSQSVPLVIYLHGSSKRGSDLNRLKAYGLPFYVDRGHQYNFIIASPQCPAGKSWLTDDWFGPLYAQLRQNYRIDTTRVYVMGMSLGGYGTWHVALDYPEVFAALVPICGGCLDSANICKIGHIPTWAFHGKKDKAVPFSETEKLVNRLQQCGGNIRFTPLPDKGHNLAYLFNDADVLMWMLSQQLHPDMPHIAPDSFSLPITTTLPGVRNEDEIFQY
jgi:predicted peptidase